MTRAPSHNWKAESWYSQLREHCRDSVFSVGETIRYQGESGTHVGVVMSGRAKAVSYSQTGDAIWLGEYVAGDFLGHISLLTDRAGAYDVIAQTDMIIMMVPFAKMRPLLDGNTAMTTAMSRDLANRLDLMMNRMIESLTLSAKGRVCAELVRLCVVMGVSPDKAVIRPSPVFVELALRVNSTRETVSRTVSGLQKQGIISREPGAIIIQSPDRLKASIQ